MATLVLACAPGTTPRAVAPAGTAPALVLRTPASEVPPERLLLVAVHGLSPERYLDPVPAMPTLAGLAAQGLAADALVPAFPPAPYPALTTLVTGQQPARHGVPADRLLGDRGVRAEFHAHASHVRAPTLWQLASEAGLPAAALDWPATGGAAVAGLLPDVLPRRSGETWAGLLDQWATPWLAELARGAGAEAPAAARPGPERDAVLASVACAVLESNAPPGLLLLRLSQTAAALESHGPQSEEARRAFAGADAELARILACLDRAGRLERAAVVVAGDHGTLAVHTAVRPNALLAEAGLVSVDKHGVLTRWNAVVRSNGGSAFLYARDEDAAVLARRALAAAAAETRAFRIVSAQEMLRLGADPEAWFGLEAEPGYRFEDAARGPAVGVSSLRAAGGYLPERPGMQAGFVAWGAGFRARIRVPEIHQADVAPTLARMLGLRLGPVDGRPLVGLLGPSRRRGAAPRRGAGGDGG